jgi:hypothetical protein
MPHFVSTSGDEALNSFPYPMNYVVLFSIGLSIYLWNIHVGAAVPVITITSIAGYLYPYRLFMVENSYSMLGGSKQSDNTDLMSDTVPMDHVTSGALSWMISNSEIPSSVDTTLQAIAGADISLPSRSLLYSKAVVVAAQCLKACFSSQQLPLTNEGFGSLVKLGPGSPTFRLVVLHSRALSLLVQNGERDVPNPEKR